MTLLHWSRTVSALFLQKKRNCRPSANPPRTLPVFTHVSIPTLLISSRFLPYLLLALPLCGGVVQWRLWSRSGGDHPVAFPHL